MKKMYLKPSIKKRVVEIKEIIATSPDLRYQNNESADNSTEALSTHRRIWDYNN